MVIIDELPTVGSTSLIMTLKAIFSIHNAQRVILREYFEWLWNFDQICIRFQIDQKIMQKSIFTVLFCLIFSCTFSQSVLYRGIAVDAEGKPIGKAIVRKVKTQQPLTYHSSKDGAVADIFGKYSIYLENNDVIHILRREHEYEVYQFRRDPFDDTIGELYKLQSSTVSQKSELSFKIEVDSNLYNGQTFERTGLPHAYRHSFRLRNKVPSIYGANQYSVPTLMASFHVGANILSVADRVDLQHQYLQSVDGFSWGSEKQNITMQPSVFRNGYQLHQSVNLDFYIPTEQHISFTLKNNIDQGVLSPNMGNTINTRLKYAKQFSQIHHLAALIELIDIDEKMPLIGNNQANVLMGAYLFPMDADRNQEVSSFYSNPWMLMDKNEDRLKNNKFLGSVQYKFARDRWLAQLQHHFQRQKYSLAYGLPSSLNMSNEGLFYQRDLMTKQFETHLKVDYSLSGNYNSDLKLVSQVFLIQQLADLKNVERRHNSIFDERMRDRSIEVQTGLEYESSDSDTNVKLIGSLLNTTRSKERNAFNFLVEAKQTVDIYTDPFEDMLFWVKFHHHHIESAQINNDIQFSSLTYSLLDFQNYIPHQELTLRVPIDKLQQKTNYELGMFLRGNRLELGGNFYQYFMKNTYVPFYEVDHYVWKNGVDYQQSGWKAWVSARPLSGYRDLRWKVDLDVRHYKNRVNRNLINQEHIPFVGFQEVYKAFVEGQPVGVIIGSAYARDDQGRLLIDESSGFPMVDSKPKVLGNPNPNFVSTLVNNLSFKGYSLDMHWEWSQGGQVWNGTNQTLHYFGRSEETARLRNTKDYVYDGVYASAVKNDKAVVFHDPDHIDENRWVRYGKLGVAEDAIEDASFVRMSHLVLSRYFRSRSRYLDNIRVSLFAENLLLFSAYKGNFPSTALMGQNNAIGLDYFNGPMIKKYGVNFKFQF